MLSLSAKQKKKRHFHIGDCESALKTVPKCSQDQKCGISCLALWLDHLDRCSSCVDHIVTWPLCGNNVCLRVARCWHLKGDVIEHLEREKLTLNGGVFQEDLKNLKVLLALDFEGMSYTANEESYTAKRTASVFRLLKYLKDFRRFLQTDAEHKIDGVDLSSLLDSILSGLSKQSH